MLTTPTLRQVAIVAAIAACLATNGAPVDRQPASAPTAPVPRRRPDIVLITIDALRADHLSAYGYRRFTSPAIDRIAARGRVFTNATTQAPYTKAAVASLMSGLYPSAHKTITVTVAIDDAMTGRPTTATPSTDVLPSGITTLAEALHGSGYRTLGFTANPFLIDAFGFGQGFDVFEFYPGGEFATVDRLIDGAVAAVQQSGGGPVFLWVHMMEPHSPYDPPAWADDLFALEGTPRLIPDLTAVPPWLERGTPPDLRIYERDYDSEIAVADAGVGTLLRAFSQARGGAAPLTVITADHGEQFLEHGGFEHNTTLYEELIRVPLIVSGPGLGAGIVDTPVELIDLFPTLLKLSGSGAAIDLPGRDLQEVISAAGSARPVYAENQKLQSSVRLDDWKLIRYRNGREELFNLRSDPREQRDRRGDEPERAAELRALLASHAAAAAERGKLIESAHAPVDPGVLDRLRALGYLGR